MKKYRITIPAFSEEIEAENESEALEMFNFDYDQSRIMSEHDSYAENRFEPEIKEVKAKKKKTKKHDPRTCENSVPCFDCEKVTKQFSITSTIHIEAESREAADAILNDEGKNKEIAYDLLANAEIDEL